LRDSYDGGANTAISEEALASNTHGGRNVALGLGALFGATGSDNTAIGAEAGYNVTTADDVICIGSSGANVSSTTWIKNIYGVTTQNGTTAPVIVSADGQLGTVASSERFKKDIATMDKTSEAILSLRPVTFHYKADAKTHRNLV
jgi:Chaperone of endosialidase